MKVSLVFAIALAVLGQLSGVAEEKMATENPPLATRRDAIKV